MSGILYNPGVEQQVVILCRNGLTFSTAYRNRAGNPHGVQGVSNDCERVFLDELFKDKWQVVSLTPTHDGPIVLILERRLRD